MYAEYPTPIHRLGPSPQRCGQRTGEAVASTWSQDLPSSVALEACVSPSELRRTTSRRSTYSLRATDRPTDRPIRPRRVHYCGRTEHAHRLVPKRALYVNGPSLDKPHIAAHLTVLGVFIARLLLRRRLQQLRVEVGIITIEASPLHAVERDQSIAGVLMQLTTEPIYHDGCQTVEDVNRLTVGREGSWLLWTSRLACNLSTGSASWAWSKHVTSFGINERVR